MNRLRNIEFDGSSKKTTAVIAGLLCALIALAFADRAKLFLPIRFLVIFAGDLCACAVITLYCGMTVRAFSSERSGVRLIAYIIADMAGGVLKMIFLLLPIVIYGGTSPLPQLLALITDLILSKIITVRSLRSTR
ncbi:MAG: hypothetical protein J1F03_05690 [Oscillospiraceae bacterium]|nr:hypothetical protein [Oscillospiraceae bacterium]